MSRYLGPNCKKCRREGEKLYLKGDRCYTEKCSMSKRPFAPGHHGKVPKKLSDYGIHLRTKQRARAFYGIPERQFRNYFIKANKVKGVTGTMLLQLLERRLDNVIYRLGMADSRKKARQLVKHGHFYVNGRKVSIPSFLVKINDVINIKEKSLVIFAPQIEKIKERKVPSWLSLDIKNGEAKVLSFPKRNEIDVPIEEQMIVEYYAR
jgi:small subunit ribosomal protein S4